MQDRLEEVDLAEVIFDMSVSLDGFARASNATPEQPLGHGGEHIQLETSEVIETSAATHLRYRIVK
jgi:hypothetical protein